MHIRNYISLSILSAALVLSGCNTGLLNGTNTVPEAPAPNTQPAAPVVTDGIRTSYADVVEKTSAAVVRIEAVAKTVPAQTNEPRTPFDDFFRQFPGFGDQQPRIERGMGSGVIVSADGTILTNAHVVEGAEKITVLMIDNKSFDAKVIGSDKPSDLAVLKIEATNMPFLSLGNSDNVRVGDIVLAIGNPLGIGQTVTAGIISAKGRRTGLSDGSYEDFLQTDAPINRGNSGGALVNLDSELIGINSQILSTSGGSIGIGFSIPSNMAKNVMEQLLRDGKVRRGMLGVNIQNITGDMAEALKLPNTEGVLISNVQAGSSADKAGIKRNDVVTAINGEKIEDSNVLRNKVAGTLPGTEIKLSILRNGEQQEITAVLGEMESDSAEATKPESNEEKPAASTGNAKLGVTMQPVTPALAKQYGLGSDSEGMVVTNVDRNGVAALAGIVRGDVLLEINRQPVNSADAVQSALDQAGTGAVALLISRRGSTVYVTVRLN